jgi:hypothetical protein
MTVDSQFVTCCRTTVQIGRCRSQSLDDFNMVRRGRAKSWVGEGPD